MDIFLINILTFTKIYLTQYKSQKYRYLIYKGLSPNLSHEVAILMLSSYTVVINCKLSMYFHEYSKDSLLTPTEFPKESSPM